MNQPDTTKQDTNDELSHNKIAEYVAEKLKQFGYISGERKCYTPKHGEDAYTIENWDADTVGMFLAQDILELFNQHSHQREQERIVLKADLAFLAGVVEGLMGEPHPYIVKNYPHLTDQPPESQLKEGDTK
jgi:hypothetical protein